MPTRTIFRSCVLVAALFLSAQPGPLTAGQTFDLELTFAKAGAIKVPVIVQEIGATGPSDPHASHH